MDGIGLAETIDALRADIHDAMVKGAGQEIQFPIGRVELEFQVAVTRDTQGTGGIKFWVLEVGGGRRYEDQQVHKVTVTLEPPVDPEGRPIKVTRRFPTKP